MPMLQHGRGSRPQKVEPPIIAGRVPPHDLDAEAAVLSAVLLDRDALDRVLEILRPEHFYSDANGRIYEAAQQLALAATPIDIQTVASWLRDRERLQQIGGAAYLAQIADATPAVAHVAAHARIVYEKWRVRQLIAQCQRIAAEGYGDVGIVQEYIDGAEQAVYELARTPESTAAQPLAHVLKAAFEQISKATERGDRITGISTGYEKLDAKTAGLHDGDLTIVAARPGMGKCLAADSEILLADGRLATIADVYRQKHAELLTLGSDYKLRHARPSRYVDDGVKPVFRVATRLGRAIETTLTHPFLTAHGWRPLSELRVGDRVAVPRQLAVFGRRAMRDCEVKLLGYLIGDGGLTSSCAIFTNGSSRVLDDFAVAAREFGGLRVRRAEHAQGGRTPSLRVAADRADLATERPAFGARLRRAMHHRSVTGRDLAAAVDVSPALVSLWGSGACAPTKDKLDDVCSALGVGASELVPAGAGAIRRRAPNALVEWLGELGLWGNGARDKFIPSVVFELPREQLALFLNRLFCTDGWATVLASGQAQLGYASSSEKLVRQVQHLLLRFGVIAQIRPRSVRYQGGRRASWQLDVTHPGSIRTFARQIGIFAKESALWAADEAVSGKKAHANRDVLPPEVWSRIEAKKGSESWASLARRAGIAGWTNLHVGKRGLSRRRTAAIAEALGDADLARLANSDVYWDEIVGIEPVGDKQVYDLTIPDTHNFVANDVCVHNTSFVLNLAVNVASPRTVAAPGPGEDGHGGLDRQEPGHGVVVFSLEMPREQLATRMVCSEGRVDLGRLRQGYLQPEDWRRLTEAASYLSSLPVWIDDTPALGILELRAKVRRIQAEYQRVGRVGLVVIDYLQLMKGRDGVNSREQEISEISRGLKQLAKELRVPVIALSQLNRAVETRTSKDKRPQLSDLRECVVGDTLVCLADGRRVPIRDLVGTQPMIVSTTSEGKLVQAQTEVVWSVGRRDVFDVRLASGRSIRATARHRLLGADGWVRVGALRPGDRLAIARRLPQPECHRDWPDARLALLGHLLGEGSYLCREPLRHTTASEDNRRLVAEAAGAEFGAMVTRPAGRGCRPSVLHGAGAVALRDWLRGLGVLGQRRAERRIPTEVFQLGDRSVATLLRHLWAASGSISVRSRKRRGAIALVTSSRGLALDTAALLLRLGIVARVRARGASGARHEVTVVGAVQERRFLALVGAFGPRLAEAERLAHALSAPTAVAACGVVSKVAIATSRRVAAGRAQPKSPTKPAVAAPMGGSGHRDLERGAVRASAPTHGRFRFNPPVQVAPYAELLADEQLRRLAQSDLYWDSVVDVVPRGRAEVFDLTVPTTAAWLADGIVSHNSGAIEQDADTIVFIYRDEYYNPETTNSKGIAELIIAKQRNGPTGKVLTRFTASCTRFDNLAPGDYPEMVDDE